MWKFFPFFYHRPKLKMASHSLIHSFWVNFCRILLMCYLFPGVEACESQGGQGGKQPYPYTFDTVTQLIRHIDIQSLPLITNEVAFQLLKVQSSKCCYFFTPQLEMFWELMSQNWHNWRSVDIGRLRICLHTQCNSLEELACMYFFRAKEKKCPPF